MIIEALIIGTTVVFVASLALGNAVHKRLHDDEKSLDEPDKPVNIGGVAPFHQIAWNTECPACGNMRALKDPIMCTLGDACVIEPHLHVYCKKCYFDFKMAPKGMKWRDQ